MKLKCNYCDPTVKKGQKQVKSIDTDVDDYIRDPSTKKYYHTECYRLHLKLRKGMTNEEVERMVSERLAAREQEMQEKVERDRFFKWLMEYYDSDLPSYFYMKVNSVRTGEHKLVKEPVDYATLLDIYQHMANYLDKLALKKQMSVSNRMNYDLAVVIGNLGEYKRFKAKQMMSDSETKEIEQRIEDRKIIERIHKNNQDNKHENFSITDIMDELLL
ncbi:hypothetical protein EDM57_04560 [Brevibacillus gelatini]|uniref:Uncharacterized protein n=1 Tax=Brevibacillus gelatini TaxID=1655277 RepID=A0A3M8B7L7_9BACL|nr:hypothetical protein [Brevibacillus gelatini]RNB59418.1 hypothetical protein EDM57_04560 [Brevibacillus gelatini]